MAQPTDLPRWSTDPGTTTEPTEAKKDDGFVAGEKPAAQTHNWLFNTIYLWCDYLKNLTSEALTWTAKQIYSLSPRAPAFEITDGASLSHDNTVYGPKNRILYSGACETYGGLVTLHAFQCTFSLESSSTVLRVAFAQRYTNLDSGEYSVLLTAPSGVSAGSGVFSIIRPNIYDKDGTGFRVTLVTNSVNLSANTISADANESLTSIAAAQGFSFAVLGNLSSYSVII